MRLRHLDSLRLDDTKVTDASIAALCENLPYLTSLSIRNTAVTDTSFHIIETKLRRLDHLYLKGSKVTVRGQRDSMKRSRVASF